MSLKLCLIDETLNMINSNLLKMMKSDVLIVNTERGDIINEADLTDFLKANPKARVASDVLADEIRNRDASPLL